MDYKRMKNQIIVLAGVISMCLFAAPSVVQAQEDIPVVGVALMLDYELATSEYTTKDLQLIGEDWGYTNLGIANSDGDNLNIRKEPSTKAKVVGKMADKAACEVLEEVDGWAHIKSGKVEGYVSLEYLLTGADAYLAGQEIAKKMAVSQTSGLNVRVEPNLNAKILTKASKNQKLEFVSDEGEWICVLVNGKKAYVSAEYVEVTQEFETALTLTEIQYGKGVSDVRMELVEYAKKFIGNPYVWGGTSLTKGADCSGFVLSVFKKFGVSLPHYSGSQANMGKRITFSELKPGDLIFYADEKGKIDHVVIYAGNGMVVHASSPKYGIRTNKYNYRTPVRYVNILGD